MTPASGREVGDSFSEFSKSARQRVDASLAQHFPPGRGRLMEAARYAVLGPGKRVRPALVFLAGEAFGAGCTDDRLTTAACAVECVHAFSLVHDDLPALDNDDLRRGRPTVHCAFDEAVAVLAGDALLAWGYRLLSEGLIDNATMAQHGSVAMSRAVLDMIEGQDLDLQAESGNLQEGSDVEQRLSLLKQLHRCKTGALMRLSIELGHLVACAWPAEKNWQSFGEDLGLLFQVRDDLLDVEGSAAELGKTPGKDREAEKLTYPGLLGLAGAHRALDELRDRCLLQVEDLPRCQNLFRDFVNRIAARSR